MPAPIPPPITDSMRRLVGIMAEDLRWAVQQGIPDLDGAEQQLADALAAHNSADIEASLALLRPLAAQMRRAARWCSRSADTLCRHRGRNLLQSAENAEYLADRLLPDAEQGGPKPGR